MDDGLKEFIQELRAYGNARKGELAGMMLEAANRLEVFNNAHKLVHREAAKGIAWHNVLGEEGTENSITIKSYVCALSYADSLMSGEDAVGMFSAYEEELNAVHTEDSLRPMG